MSAALTSLPEAHRRLKRQTSHIAGTQSHTHPQGPNPISISPAARSRIPDIPSGAPLFLTIPPFSQPVLWALPPCFCHLSAHTPAPRLSFRCMSAPALSASAPRAWLLWQAVGSLAGLMAEEGRSGGRPTDTGLEAALALSAEAEGQWGVCLARGASLSKPCMQPSPRAFALLTSGRFLGSLNIYILKVNF